MHRDNEFQIIETMFRHCLEDLDQVTKLGGEKHGYGTWKDPKNKSLCHKHNSNSVYHHIAEAYVDRAKIDPESGLPHMLNAIWRLMAEYERMKLDIKDAIE